jgi:hypothetical protein
VGATDFIFGQRAAVWFEKADIKLRNGGHYVTGRFFHEYACPTPLPSSLFREKTGIYAHDTSKWKRFKQQPKLLSLQ